MALSRRPLGAWCRMTPLRVTLVWPGALPTLVPGSLPLLLGTPRSSPPGYCFLRSHQLPHPQRLHLVQRDCLHGCGSGATSVGSQDGRQCESSMTCEKWNISCHISKQGRHSHQWSWPSTWTGKPWETQGWKEYPTSSSHSLWWSLKKLKMWKYELLAPGSWGTFQKNHFNESICIFSYTEEYPKIIKLRCLVFF